MHLQQTKRESAKSGGPQYYFHNLSDVVKTYLRSKGVVPVALVTPYGATKSSFKAVSEDRKLDKVGKLLPGSVGHDRIQHGIGEAIRHWYNLPAGQFERIDVEINVIDDAFYIQPTICKYAESTKVIKIQRVERPLTFTTGYQSQFWRDQLNLIKKTHPELLRWSIGEIARVVAAHRPGTKVAHVSEIDLLRAAGPLHHFGVAFGPYLVKGYDCNSMFSFQKFPTYEAPIEVKRYSQGFTYQQKKYGKDELSRAVVLCAGHNLANVPVNIDVVELEAFCKYGREALSLSVE